MPADRNAVTAAWEGNAIPNDAITKVATVRSMLRALIFIPLWGWAWIFVIFMANFVTILYLKGVVMANCYLIEPGPWKCHHHQWHLRS